MAPDRRRRALLASIVPATGAGCVGGADPPEGSASLPTVEGERPGAHSMATLREGVIDTGLRQDGIPSVDDPSFVGARDADYADGDPVFGLVRNGEVRAYPQEILVHHEIVNDRIGGEGVAITYCPLTGTVQSFERGDVEFGVSGDLLSSNLVMYDRATESLWPQIPALAIEGAYEGAGLTEFEVVWTTWSRWTSIHPETEVLTEDTGALRDYGRDDYGNYNPLRGYYASDDLVYAPLLEDDRLHPKRVVLGARTGEGALAVAKDRLRNRRLLDTTVGGVPYAVVYDPALDTGHVYRNAGGRSVGYDGRPTVGGEDHAPDELPLEPVVRFDAMWFAWVAFYPRTELLA